VYLPSLKRALDLPILELAGKVRPAIVAMLLTGAIVIYAAPLLGPLTLSAYATKLTLVLVVFLGSYGLMTRWMIFREIMQLVKGRGAP
jgi:hypothetical protein